MFFYLNNEKYVYLLFLKLEKDIIYFSNSWIFGEQVRHVL